MCTDPILTYRVATDITAPIVECTHCDASIDLGALRNQRHDCPGDQPWLPGIWPELCTQRAQVMERTATGRTTPRCARRFTCPTVRPSTIALWRCSLSPSRSSSSAATQPARRPMIGISIGSPPSPPHAASPRRQPYHPPRRYRGRGGPRYRRSRARVQELAALLDATDKSCSGVGLPPLIVETRSLGDYHSALFAGDTRRFSAVSAVPLSRRQGLSSGSAALIPADLLRGKGLPSNGAVRSTPLTTRLARRPPCIR